MNETQALGIALGIVAGLGLWMIVARLPRLGRPPLAERIAPYLVDVSAEARRTLAVRSSDPSGPLSALLVPGLSRLRGGFDRLLGGNEIVAKRLRQAGRGDSVDQFRGQQLIWAGCGLVAGGAVAILAPGVVAAPVVVRLALPILGGAGAAIAKDWLLQRAAQRRLARISEELPTVLEFLTLCLTAAESLPDALRRISRIGAGELAQELSGVLAAVGAGVPLAVALRDLRDGVDHPALNRALDQALGALERGAPLAAVFRAQAGDVRDESKRALLELAGRKEIAMLVPLVFLILPITILFALFPGYLVLRTGF
ncbi:MAG TPA: type II secretion system F family protein [Candidatus Lumbricidophila sp.]|nr:type II secretion system F family protein [Candidatus Lumbricidophila sp.]